MWLKIVPQQKWWVDTDDSEQYTLKHCKVYYCSIQCNQFSIAICFISHVCEENFQLVVLIGSLLAFHSATTDQCKLWNVTLFKLRFNNCLDFIASWQFCQMVWVNDPNLRTVNGSTYKISADVQQTSDNVLPFNICKAEKLFPETINLKDS